MTRLLCATISLLALTANGLAADAKNPPASQPAPNVVRIGQVRVDLKNRQVSFDTEVCLNEGALEFVLVQWKSKTHESILHTKAKASHIHAGLLMLGLTAGKPARWSGMQAGARFLPPAGAGLKLRMVWKDANGVSQCADAGEWLAGRDGQDIERPERWIFIGSDILPGGRYWAELEGEIISLTNFASAVIDVPFESSSVDEQHGIFANTKKIPPPGTKVAVVITPEPGAEKAPDARETVEIDRFGHTLVNGQVFSEDQLEKWASKYITAHARGMVVIRVDGRALAWDITATESVLRFGGVRDFDIQRLRPRGKVLPRSADQAIHALARWKDDFINYRDLLEDPGRTAKRTLARIEAKTRELEAQKALLKDYAAELKAALATYMATSQPAFPAEGLSEDGN